MRDIPPRETDCHVPRQPVRDTQDIHRRGLVHETDCHVHRQPVRGHPIVGRKNCGLWLSLAGATIGDRRRAIDAERGSLGLLPFVATELKPLPQRLGVDAEVFGRLPAVPSHLG